MPALYSLNAEQRANVGPSVTDKLRTARPNDAVALGLATKVDGASQDIVKARAGGEAAHGQRAGKVAELVGMDRRRDRAISAANHVRLAWELRDDLPEKQEAAITIGRELFDGGLAFLTWGYTEESGEIQRFLEAAKKPAVVQALATLGLADFVTNVEQRETEFVSAAGDKQGVHVEGRESTAAVRRAVGRWDNAMRALVNHLIDEYPGGTGNAELASLLQPLTEAEAVGRSRETRKETAKAAKKDGDNPVPTDPAK